ncbi:hypothetical protein EW026_g435 [Hermanssonia centrifuga]|uniref:Uncharacterized protein n=1 Tax=Hermanssonia centrifuga TaxID=98765 RepID=A0A4S4KZ59_9APHY|nr:hypothetical protein EW026_g435 [Hermanssonia centrifuga]
MIVSPLDNNASVFFFDYAVYHDHFFDLHRAFKVVHRFIHYEIPGSRLFRFDLLRCFYRAEYDIDCGFRDLFVTQYLFDVFVARAFLFSSCYQHSSFPSIPTL